VRVRPRSGGVPQILRSLVLCCGGRPRSTQEVGEQELALVIARSVDIAPDPHDQRKRGARIKRPALGRLVLSFHFPLSLLRSST